MQTTGAYGEAAGPDRLGGEGPESLDPEGLYGGAEADPRVRED